MEQAYIDPNALTNKTPTEQMDYLSSSLQHTDMPQETFFQLFSRAKQLGLDLNAPISINEGELKGYRLVHETHIHGNINALKALAQAGADIYARNNQGETILHLIGESENYTHQFWGHDQSHTFQDMSESHQTMASFLVTNFPDLLKIANNEGLYPSDYYLPENNVLSEEIQNRLRNLEAATGVKWIFTDLPAEDFVMEASNPNIANTLMKCAKFADITAYMNEDGRFRLMSSDEEEFIGFIERAKAARQLWENDQSTQTVTHASSFMQTEYNR